MITIYNDDRTAVMLLDNGDVRVDTRNFVFGTNDPDGTINSVIIPRNAVTSIVDTCSCNI